MRAPHMPVEVLSVHRQSADRTPDLFVEPPLGPPHAKLYQKALLFHLDGWTRPAAISHSRTARADILPIGYGGGTFPRPSARLADPAAGLLETLSFL